MGIATTATLVPAPRQLSDQNSLGTVLGASPTDLIGFYGATAIPQNTTAISISTGTVAQVITALGNLGLIKTTA
jgi:hypothetical protein